MFALFSLENKLYRRRISTYVTASLFLLLASVPFAYLNLLSNSSDLASSLRAASPALFLAVPAYLCASAQNRRRTGIDLLARSLPVSASKRVLARWLAALCRVLLPFVLLALYPLLFSLYGDVPFAAFFVAFMGFVLLAAFLVSLVQYVLSFFRTRLLSDVFGFGIPVFLYLYDVLLSFLPSGRVVEILYIFSVPDRFFALTHGKLDLSSILFFVCGTVFFLVLSILSERTARTSGIRFERLHQVFALLSVLLICLLVILPTVCSLLPEKLLRRDMTGSVTYRISAKTKDALSSVSEDVEIILVSSGGKRHADADFYSFLREYADLNPHLSLRVLDPDIDAAALEPFRENGVLPPDGSVVISSSRRHRSSLCTNLFYYYNSELDMSFLPSDYFTALSAYASYSESGSFEGLNEYYVQLGYYLVTYSTSTTVYFYGDEFLLNAIRYAVADLPLVGIYDTAVTPVDDLFLSYLTSSNYDYARFSSFSALPSGCSAVLLNAPTKDLTAEEAVCLSSYLSSGGKVFLTTSCLYTNQPNLFSVLSSYGLSLYPQKNILCEGSASALYDTTKPSCFYVTPALIPETGSFSGAVMMINPHAIVTEKMDGVSLRPWLSTTSLGYLRFTDDSNTSASPSAYVCGVVARSGDSSLIWISSPDILSQTGYALSSGGNFAFAVTSFSALSPSSFSEMSLDPVALPPASFSVPDLASLIWSFVLVFVLPALVLAVAGLKKR